MSLHENFYNDKARPSMKRIHGEPREFKEKDWHFWKDNMFDYLNPGGQLFLKTNLKFQKHVVGGMQTEIIKAFGVPIKGFNSYTYHFTKP